MVSAAHAGPADGAQPFYNTTSIILFNQKTHRLVHSGGEEAELRQLAEVLRVCRVLQGCLRMLSQGLTGQATDNQVAADAWVMCGRPDAGHCGGNSTAAATGGP